MEGGDTFNHYQTERDTADTYEWIHIGWIHTDYYTDVEAARSMEEASAAAWARYKELGEAAKKLLFMKWHDVRQDKEGVLPVIMSVPDGVVGMYA